ncbi:MAG TPA: hypothetical protein VNX27_11365 [Chthoniobacterales bacterium]|jgi:hypothetical protein|nr:hypothetical protein [Chthoniobacterales bacterium]
MNEQAKREKKTKTKNKDKAQIRDLKPKKDIKGGEEVSFNFTKQGVHYTH